MGYHFSTDDLHHLADLLTKHRSLLATHPNDGDLSIIPENWTTSPEELTRYYTAGVGGDLLPIDLKDLISDIRALQIPREPIDMSNGRLLLMPTKKGMSPKKFHEVQRMASYVKALVDSIYENCADQTQNRLHIVDIGAGQGYLTRALAFLFPDARLLALDADHGQTTGGERRGKGKGEHRVDAPTAAVNSRIDRKTVLITPDSLLKVVDNWIEYECDANQSVPVLFVALHACGSLTPDVLRAFLSRVSAPETKNTRWHPLSLVAVGCCYNLMYPEDYPMSKALRSYGPAIDNPLTPSSSHLAAQIPMTWLRKDPANSGGVFQPSVALATRKIVWRALLGFALAGHYSVKPISVHTGGMESTIMGSEARVKNSTDVPVKWWTQPRRGTKHSDASSPLSSAPSLPHNPSIDKPPSGFAHLPSNVSHVPLEVQLQGVGQTEAAVRLGKLPDSAYTQGWQHFLRAAGEKLGVAWRFRDAESLRNPVVERRIEMLHTVRCFLGSAVESAILLDRLQWIREELETVNLRHHPANDLWVTDLVNLFDQQEGSGRNIGFIKLSVSQCFKHTMNFVDIKEDFIGSSTSLKGVRALIKGVLEYYAAANSATPATAVQS